MDIIEKQNLIMKKIIDYLYDLKSINCNCVNDWCDCHYSKCKVIDFCPCYQNQRYSVGSDKWFEKTTYLKTLQELAVKELKGELVDEIKKGIPKEYF